MVQAHPHDTIERLWPGAADPTHPRFVPIELRDLVAAIPPAVERKLRREASKAQELYKTDPRGHAKTVTLNPADSEHDFETAVVWRKVEWARNKLASEQVAVEQARRDAVGYTCRCCGEVVPPSAINPRRHVQRRPLVDGTTIVALCGICAYDAELLAAEARLADTTRRDRLRALIAEARP